MFKVRKAHIIQIAVFGVVALILLGLFAYLVGDLSGLYQRGSVYHLQYNFAGGITTGSHVRLSGVAVGRVKSITFNTAPTSLQDTSIVITIGVDKDAATLIRTDSQFFINMAGLMGETYLEITPGSTDKPRLPSGSKARGVDPPRIDQLISEGYAVFKIVNDVIGEMKPELTQFVSELKTLLGGMNETLSALPKEEKKKFGQNVMKLIHNLAQISSGLNAQDTKAMVAIVKRLLERLDKIDEANLRQFLQKEGIRARIF